MDAFAGEYRQVIGRLFGPVKRRHGVPAADLAAAERRLGVALPRVLRDYYRLVGRHRAMNGGYVRILGLGARGLVLLDEQALHFAREEQGVEFYAVRVSDLSTRADPPVVSSGSGEPGTWRVLSRAVSWFLLRRAWMAGIDAGRQIHTAARPPSPAALLAGWPVPCPASVTAGPTRWTAWRSSTTPAAASSATSCPPTAATP